jgi:tetratricopeptide (TPR) repeat protein
LVTEKAGGNPFFVEELIRSLIETKQIVRENSHWRIADEAARVSLPDTLRGLLGARIDRLPVTTRHILQTASVIGRFFDRGVLERLAGGEALDVQIQNLSEAGLIEIAGEEYAFRHVLIQEAAYDSVLLKSRAELHRRIGETLEELNAGRIEEFGPLLAHHFYAAGDARSLQYDILAGEKAARLYANAEAATHFSRALETARRLNAGTEQVAQLYSQLGGALELSGRYQQALKNYDEMLAFARERNDKPIELNALMAEATIYSTFTDLHDSKLSEQTLIQALEISRQIGDRAAQVRLHWNLMLNYLYSKRLEESLQQAELALPLARQAGNRESLAFVLNDFCRLYTCRGEFERAHAAIREARELWVSLDNQVMLADSLGSEAESYFNAGEYEPSLEFSQKALQVSERIGNLWGQSYDRMLMAFAYFENGRMGLGIQNAEQAIRLGDEAGLIASNSLRAELAWMYAYCGAYEKGLQLIDQSLQIADAKQPAWRAFPQATKVRIYLLGGDVHSAERTAGAKLLEPISIPYARYTIFLCLANIELAMAKGEPARALALLEPLLAEVTPLTRVDVPEVLRWKALALLGLEHLDEAKQVLTEARARAEATSSNLHLWPILADLAEVNSKLGNSNEAEANRQAARGIVAQIADSLREIGLRESFLNQPRVRALMR